MSNHTQRRTVGSLIGRIITWIFGIIVGGLVIIAFLINVDLPFWAFVLAPTIIIYLIALIVATRCHRRK